MRARDVMTGSLITTIPDAPVVEVAQLMRDRDTGDVLITDDGKLLGIVTDRDIAVRAAARGMDPRETPVRHLMSKRVVTGEPNWDFDRLAKTMGKHQVRRLPIVDKGLLVGIVTLGDLALKNSSNPHVGRSLREISEPGAVHRHRHNGRGRTWATLGLAALASAVVVLTLSPKQRGMLFEQLQDGRVTDVVLDAFQQVRDRISELRN